MITEIGQELWRASRILQQGGLVAIPTETVYGLAGNALDSEAVINIYEVKGRPRFNPLIMHLPSLQAAEQYVTDIPAPLRLLAEQFSPGPLSYLLPKSSLVPDLITAGSDKVVVRIPSHPMTLELLLQIDFPLAAPSANPFGYVSPVTAEHVKEGLNGRIPYILNGGACSVGLESTIIGMEDEELIIHRVGAVTADDIFNVTGIKPRFSLLHKKPDTPGQLKSHYAPVKPLLVGDLSTLIPAHSGKKIAVISFMDLWRDVHISRALSSGGNLHEAAANLFTVLRELDKSDADLILAEVFPNTGIGQAINDRLSRAGGRV
jgi:L-threonylcarbamoyladenylate synthase